MSASAESARAARLALITAEDDRRRKRAEQLGLPWPRPCQRPTAGRSSRETHYINALYSEVSKASDLSLVSKTCPPRWMRGKPLVRQATRRSTPRLRRLPPCGRCKCQSVVSVSHGRSNGGTCGKGAITIIFLVVSET